MLKKSIFIISFVVGVFLVNHSAFAKKCDQPITSMVKALPKSSIPALKLYCQRANIYYFSVSGLEKSETVMPQDLILLDPTKAKISLPVQSTLRADSNGNIVFSVSFSGKERMGEWQISLKTSKAKILMATLNYESQTPHLFLLNTRKMKNGMTVYNFLGSGWQQSEKLVFVATAPNGSSQKNENVKVDAYGLTQILGVPFVENPKDGNYTFELISAKRRAKSLIQCSSGKCELVNG